MRFKPGSGGRGTEVHVRLQYDPPAGRIGATVAWLFGHERRTGAVPLGHLPHGYMAAENCDIQRGDTIAVWGCGPVGQMAVRSAFLLGAERVIAIDDVPDRHQGGAQAAW